MALTQVSTGGVKDGTILNADINASAAIAGTKISPDFGSQNIVTTGSTSSAAITATGLLKISNIFPRLLFEDTNNNDDFSIYNANGTFRINDDTDNAPRLDIASDGTVDIFGNLDVGAGIDVTGAITGTGDLTIDTNTLHVDSSNNRVGIGTTSPSTIFVVSNAGAEGLEVSHSSGTVELNAYNRSGSARSPVDIIGQTFKVLTGNPSLNNGLFQDSSGRVQIGSTNNSATGTKLVVGSGNNISATALINTQDTDINALTLSNWDGATTSNKVLIGFDNSGRGSFSLGMPASENAFAIYGSIDGSSNEFLRITSTGKIGIGTTPGGTPANKNAFLAIGDSDTGIVQDGDGQFEIFANAVEVANFNAIDGYTSSKNITTTGKVGIGRTTGNSANLLVQSGAQVFAGASDGNSSCLTMDYNTANGAGRIMGHASSGGILQFFTNASGAGVTPRLTIDSTGNVGIGTTSPLTDAQLTISHTDTPALAFQRSGSGKFETAIQISSGHFFFKAGADSSTVSGLSDVMKIESTGNVGIGTTSPSNLLTISAGNPVLELQGTTANGGNTFLHINANANHWCVGADNFTSQNMFVIKSGTPSSSTHTFAINPSGNVGIGTVSPDTQLVVSSSDHTGITIESSRSNATDNIGALQFQTGSTDVALIQTLVNGSMRFRNTSSLTERMRIINTGEVRIQHDDNSEQSVSTDPVHGIGSTSLDTVTSNLARLVMQERVGNWISFKTGGGTHYGTISRNGSYVVYGGQSSDYRIKENVVNVSNGITLLKQLRPVNFNYTSDSGFTAEELAIVNIGFIAHEFAEICPSGVIGEKDGMDIWGDCTNSEGETTQTHVPESKKKDGETWTEKSRKPNYQQIDFSKAVPILTAALQEAVAKIETLETKVAAL